MIEKQDDTEYIYSTDIMKREGRKHIPNQLLPLKIQEQLKQPYPSMAILIVQQSLTHFKIDKDSYNLTDTSRYNSNQRGESNLSLYRKSKIVSFNEKLSIIIYL